jgi:hypothetical protein
MIFFATPDSYRDSQIKMIYAVSVFSPRITQIKRIKIGVIRGKIFYTINNP